jgi:uncharacterized surface protein with fasciclin (FAS1) repeats
MKMRKLALIVTALAVLATMIAPSFAQTDDTIVDVAVANEDFSTLVAAVTEAELVEALSGDGPFTIFAPTNDAFAALLEGMDMSAEDLLANENLADILLYHVVAGEWNADAVIELVGENAYVLVDTLAGTPVKVSVQDGAVYINDAQVIAADVEASNGVIHVVDSVIVPPSQTIAEIVVEAADMGEDSEFTILLAAVLQADLAEALSGDGPFTVFAPTDAAFAAAMEALDISAEDLLANPDLASILLYHVVGGEEALYSNDVAAALDGMDDGVSVDTLLEGDPIKVTANEMGVYVDGALVVQTDILASNGVIHVIDAVLLPDSE